MNDENNSVMETLIVQIKSEKAYNLLKSLESLDVIKILEKDERPSQKLSEKYAGKLPWDVADMLQSYVAKNRSEWSNRGI